MTAPKYADAIEVLLNSGMTLHDITRDLMVHAVMRNDYNVGAAARNLNIGRTTLYRRLWNTEEVTAAVS